MDEILKRAAWSGWLHLYDMPYNSAVSKLINVKFENVVYTVSLALDGSTACVDGYWGSCQRVVAGDNMATADQLKSLVDRWLTTT
ncbi:hypothetical protein ACIBAH_34830 [Streptomyces sp. NPDC051445]|uniref:hypothetical protein n=1 Tax=Streptomyces sp. NPDC051445 TaxID=3365653 RepID=UPI00378E23A0